MGTKPKITILNITARAGGMDILLGNLKRQIFKDFDLVIVDALWEKREEKVKEYFKDFNLTYVRQSPKRKGAYSNLAHADNEGFKVCQGELIVCLQDYIWIPPFALHKFWEAHSAFEGRILISGVGHQYGVPGKDDIYNHEGRLTVFHKEFFDRPELVVWKDPRMRLDQGTFYETSPTNWEMNYCAIPRSIIYELGGMDEEYDFHGFAYDNVNIAQRAEMLGYKTYLDQTNECRALAHDDWAMADNKKDRSTQIAEFHIQTLKDTIRGVRPINLGYL